MDHKTDRRGPFIGNGLWEAAAARRDLLQWIDGSALACNDDGDDI